MTRTFKSDLYYILIVNRNKQIFTSIELPQGGSKMESETVVPNTFLKHQVNFIFALDYILSILIVVPVSSGNFGSV